MSFDIPSPPSYGGVIDVYYKVKALAELGVKVHLHCFEYGRERAKDLKELCTEVHYYSRRQGKYQLLSNLPFVVTSRRSEALLTRLLKDDHPILFEGLHTCYYLGDPRLLGRTRLVRAHNVEHDYYAALAKAEEGLVIKLMVDGLRISGKVDKLSTAKIILVRSDAVAIH